MQRRGARGLHIRNAKVVSSILASGILKIKDLRSIFSYGNFGCKNCVIPFLLNSSIFPFAGQFFSDGNAAHPLFNPIFRISLSFV
jgi:hypothetical protein